MKRRRGFSHMELVVATVLLVATLLTISTFRQRTLSSNLAAQQSSFAQSRLLNLRREVSTWPLNQVTAEAIAKTPVDNTPFLPQSSWVVDVKDIEQPIIGKQVMIAIQWHDKSLPHISPSLTFWVKQP